jgi:hypothetical protein
MNGRHLFLAAAAIAVFVAVVWLMDPLLLYILGLGPLIWIGLPASLIAGFRLLVGTRPGATRHCDVTVLCIVGEFGCFVALAIPINHFTHQDAVAAAKEYPAQIAPLLEAYRQAHGSYPSSLDQIPTKPVVPRFLRRPHSYRSKDDRYSFSFGGFMGTWYYDSRTRLWHS